MKYSCGHNLQGEVVPDSNLPPDQLMPTSSGLCPKCVADRYERPVHPGWRQAWAKGFREILPIPASKETIDYAAEAVKRGGPIHIAGGKGPHLLRDRKGNTAYCGGPGLCEFCEVWDGCIIGPDAAK